MARTRSAGSRVPVDQWFEIFDVVKIGPVSIWQGAESETQRDVAHLLVWECDCGPHEERCIACRTAERIAAEIWDPASALAAVAPANDDPWVAVAEEA